MVEKNNNQNYNEIDEEAFIRQQKRAKKRKELEKKRRRRQRREKINKFIDTTKSSIRKISGKILSKIADPHLIVSAATAFMLYQQINKYQTQYEEQQKQIQYIERTLQETPKFSMKKYLKENWGKVALTAGPVIIQIGRHVYIHMVTKQELAQTQNQLVQTKGELSHTTQKLNRAEEETVRVKTESEIQLKKIKEDHQIAISKLHLTLNRFNDAALESAKRETQMRNQIQECKNKLVQVLEQRDLVKEELENYEMVNGQKDEELQQISLKMRVVQTQLEDQEIHEARLIADLKQLQEQKKWWSLKEARLKTQVKSAEESRQEVYKKFSLIKKEKSKIEFEKQKLEFDIKTQQKHRVNAEQEVKRLQVENSQNHVLLQKAIDKTNRYAIRMDEAKKQIDEYEKINLSNQEKLNFLQQEIDNKQINIQNKEQIIKNRDQKNQQLEEQINIIQNQLNENLIQNDILNTEIQQAKEDLKKSSAENQAKIQKMIKEKQKIAAEYQKSSSKLKERIKNEGKKLALSYIEQDKLIQEITRLKDQEISDLRDIAKKRKANLDKQFNQQKADFKKKEESFFSLLQSEREIQEEKFNSVIDTHQELINQLLNQQEQDQKKTWWEKIQVNLNPSVSIDSTDSTKNQKKEILQRQHHFYPSWATEQTTVQRVTEEYSPEKDKWEIIADPSKQEQDKRTPVWRTIKRILF